MAAKLKIFTNHNLGPKITRSIVKLKTIPGVMEISCLPDIYQKEHTTWPSGITVVTNGIILPELLNGIGCGVSIFKLTVKKKINESILKKMLRNISLSISNRAYLRSAAIKFKEQNSIILLKKYLNKSNISHLDESWRNDTLSSIRFKQLDKNILKKYINWPPNELGLALIEGNHFIELQEVEEVFDIAFCNKIRIKKGDYLLMIHLETEGFNKDIETRFLKEYGNLIKYPSKEADEYISLSNINQRHCFINRIVIAEAINTCLRKKKLVHGNLSFIFETSHTGLFQVQNKSNQIYHHSGSTPAFPPGDRNLSKEIRKFGQPLILPGAMGIESYILKTSSGTKMSSYTVNHGLGRKISKKYARANYHESDVRKSFNYHELLIKQVSGADLVSQMSICYKDIDTILEVMIKHDLVKKVAKIKPLGAIKG